MQTKPTMATIKSFIKKNQGKLYIKNLSNFDGMVDCVMPCEDKTFNLVNELDQADQCKNSLGMRGAWFVLGGRDSISQYLDNQFKGYKIYNCCNSFI